MALGLEVAVPPRSPIGYNPSGQPLNVAVVAVPPRSPIGYNASDRWGYRAQLRFPPDLPSGIMVYNRIIIFGSCGSPPISHRV